MHTIVVLFINILLFILDHQAGNYCFHSMHVNMYRHTHLQL
uniref:Uncharacterized protein n=1 Tax=Arundo donax TaxID=35708 RepID=A0A0A9AHK0_ARUDO